MSTVEAVAAAFVRPMHTNPAEVRDRCVWESEDFAKACRAAGVRQVTVVSGFATVLFGEVRVITMGHTAVRVGDTVYDWTARQFNPDAPVPLVLPYEEWRASWPDLATERSV